MNGLGARVPNVPRTEAAVDLDIVGGFRIVCDFFWWDFVKLKRRLHQKDLLCT